MKKGLVFVFFLSMIVNVMAATPIPTATITATIAPTDTVLDPASGVMSNTNYQIVCVTMTAQYLNETAIPLVKGRLKEFHVYYYGNPTAQYTLGQKCLVVIICTNTQAAWIKARVNVMTKAQIAAAVSDYPRAMDIKNLELENLRSIYR